MPSFEQQYYLGNASWLERRRRDLRLLASLLRGLYWYATAGTRLRRGYRKARQQGRVLWLDDESAP
ncbi:MAG: hypothetical protein R3E77_04900 [Steroidobacteraceae bacterium]